MKSINNYLNDAEKKWGNNPYINIKSSGVFYPKSFSKVICDVKSVAKSIVMRFGKEKKIIIFSENSYEWMILDLAIMGYCGICIPIDKEWTTHDIENAMNFINVDIVFYSVSKSEIVKKIASLFPNTEFVGIDKIIHELISIGKAANNNFLIPQEDLGKTVKIIFTSGTTAFPKAIPLTQSNLFNNWDTLFKRTPMTEKDTTCIFLPLNHVYSGVANFLYTIISGMQIFLCEEITSHVTDIISVEPTVVCTVPLLLKRMYLNMNSQLLKALKKIRFLYCGGSFTEPEIKRWFRENGVNLIEAYGTTETSSVIALDIIGDSCIESNGTVFENLDVKIIDPDAYGYGEILVKGGSRTSGYLNCQYNERYFDSNGFFHTGDLGRLDSNRRLYLKGRKKRMLETSDGKNVYADEIEELILQNGIANKVKVYLEEYKITALIYSNSCENDVKKQIDIINKMLPEFKKIKKLYVNNDFIGSRIK